MQTPAPRIILAFCCIMLFGMFTLSAQTVYNVPTGSYPTIQSAINAASNGDIIAISAGVIPESGINLNKSLTLRGAGQGSTIVEGASGPKLATTRIFQVTSGVTVRFEKMTIRHGYARSGASSSFFSGGGAIDFNQCNFTIEDVTFKDNNCLTTASLSGGALTIKGNTSGGADCVINRCRFEGNRVGESPSNISPDGGAIHVSGDVGSPDLIIDSCVFVRNITRDRGGAIFAEGKNVKTIISNSTFEQNQAEDDAGAVHLDHFSLTSCTFEGNYCVDEGGAVRTNSTGDQTITNCTFYNNQGRDGGAISIQINTPGSMTLTNNTIYNNTGSGIFISNGTGPVNLINNLLSNNNIGPADIDIENNGTIGTNNNNLVEGCSGTCPLFAVNATLTWPGTFANHGGFTKTLSLLSGSNAINVGTSTGAPTEDQRGYPRIVGNTDIGAYEFGALPVQINLKAVCGLVDLILLGPDGVGILNPIDMDNGTSGGTPPYSFAASPTRFTCSDYGGNFSTLTVTDAVGATSTCYSLVRAYDPTPPTPKCQPITVQLDVAGQKTIAGNALDNGSSDICTALMPSNFSISPSSFTCDDIGVLTATMTVSGRSRQTSSCSANLTVQDAIAPKAICRNITVQLDGSGDAAIASSEIDGGSTDNCGIAAFTASQTHFGCSDTGPNTVTLTVTDSGNGLTDACTATVTVTSRYNILSPLASQGCGSCGQIRSTICQFDPAPDLDTYVMANANYEPGASLNWYVDNSGSIGSLLAGAPLVNPAGLGTQWYWVSQQLGGCEGPAIRVRVRVKRAFPPEFNLPDIGCGGTAQLDLAAWVSDPGNKTTLYTFYSVDPVANPGATPIGTASAYNGVVNFGQTVIVDVMTGSQTYWVQNTVPNGCGGTASATLSAVATPASLDFIPNLNVNCGDPVNIVFSGTNATNIIWFDFAGFSNPNIGIMGSAGMGSLSFTATNTSGTAQTATIRVIPYNGNCAGQLQDFTITVQPGVGCRQATVNSLQLAASRPNAHDVTLNWNINSEFKLIRFEVEKKRNEGEFEAIGFQNWKGNGAYEFTDESAMSNANQYRLKLIYADGRIVWSKTVEVNMDFVDNHRFDLFPNPTSGQFQVKALFPMENSYTWQLTDVMGKTLMTGEMKSQQTTIQVESLATGMYHLVMKSPEGKRYLMKIIKQ